MDEREWLAERFEGPPHPPESGAILCAIDTTPKGL